MSTLAKIFQGLGHDVGVVVPHFGEKVEHDRYEGISVYRYPVPASPFWEEVQGTVSPRFFSHFVDLIQSLRPDVIHFHTTSWTMGLTHIKAAYRSGAVTLLTHHTPSLGYLCPRGTGMLWGKVACDGIVTASRCSVCLLQQKGIPPILGNPLGRIPPAVGKHFQTTFKKNKFSTLVSLPFLIEQRKEMHSEILDHVHAVICLTEWGRQTLLRNGTPSEKLILCRLGVAGKNCLGKSSRPSSEPCLVMGYIGRYDPIKGLEPLLKAFMKLPSKEKVTLRIYGVSNEDSTYEHFLRKMAQPDARIKFENPLKPDQVRKALRELDVLAVPSLCMEGGPTVLLEALAEKVPVIGSDLGAIPEYIQAGKNGLLFPPGDIEAIQQTLTRLSSDRELLSNLVEGIEDVRTLQDVAREHMEFYTSLNPKRSLFQC
ncbi:MAG: glycosyltransferase [Candidatus Omnitrophica bacterium]|nr:glycosyltransferase [Candidatus Omnitrophota bacterium]